MKKHMGRVKDLKKLSQFLALQACGEAGNRTKLKHLFGRLHNSIRRIKAIKNLKELKRIMNYVLRRRAEAVSF